MFNGTDPCWIPDIPVSRRQEWRLREANFGDGYSQRTLDGINALELSWSVTFENRDETVIAAMDAYLTAAHSGPFVFLDPQSGKTYSVFCDSWQIDWNLKRRPRGQPPITYGTLSAEFKRANGVFVTT